MTAFALIVLGGCQRVAQFWGIIKNKEKPNNNKCLVCHTIIFYKIRKKDKKSDSDFVLGEVDMTMGNKTELKIGTTE